MLTSWSCCEDGDGERSGAGSLGRGDVVVGGHLFIFYQLALPSSTSS